MAGDSKVQRNHEKIQEALTALRDVEASINELEYLERYLKSSNHSKELCKSTITLINDLNRTHADVVNALIYYGNQYGSCQVNLVNLNNPNYQPVSSYPEFTYEHAPEHQKSFWEKTWNQIVLGDFSDDTTWLGTTTNIILSFTGIDALLDARDFAGSASKGDGLGMVLNGISLLPVFGVIGELGKAGKAAKHLDDISDVGTTVAKNVDAFVDTGTTVVKHGDDLVDAGNTALKQDEVFSWTIKGENVVLDDVKMVEIKYVKRSSIERDLLRKSFNSSERKAFLLTLGQNPEYLKKMGFSDMEILKIQKGIVPTGWNVHHIFPLDDSGLNRFDNLVLIKNDPYHRLITNYQNSFAKGLKPGDEIIVKWPKIDSSIYPKIK